VDKDGSAYTIAGIDPRRRGGIAFFHLERKLAGYISLKGDEKEGPTVKLQPWAGIRGRILDADGKPMGGIGVRLEYIDEAGKHLHLDRLGRIAVGGLLSDAEGKFALDGIVPGLKCKVILLDRVQPKAQPTVVIHVTEEITCKPDETRDLGDVKSKPMK
jgi:hypothetical protein